MTIMGMTISPAIGKIRPISKKNTKAKITFKNTEVAININLINTKNRIIPNKISI